MDKKMVVKILGMHCAACETLIERKFQKVPGVKRVAASLARGRADVEYDTPVSIEDLDRAVRNEGYTVSGSAGFIEKPKNWRDYGQLGMIVVIVVALFLLLRRLHLLPNDFGVNETMSLWLVFGIGLVAAVSTCMAVTGGLLLSVAARFNEQHQGQSGRQRFKPHLFFNIGRIVSYMFLGGVVGAIGSTLSLSAQWNGALTILVSLVMVILGLQMLNIFPWLTRFQPRLPKALAHRIYNAAEGKQNKVAPFVFGALTFFLPCGFTQALQLYVLSKGDWLTGMLTMGVFALGTLPALMSLSAILSFAKGKFQQYFMKFAAVVVVLIGIFNISNGIVLAGLGKKNTPNTPLTDGEQQVAQTGVPYRDPNVQIVNGVQIVKMKIVGYEYQPANVTVYANMPVEWQIDASQAAGCAQAITVPKLKITQFLPKDGIKKITFTPTEAGNLGFSCTMGMTTPGAAFKVISGTPPTDSCDPLVMNCINN
ncbi:MAG: sulfite exporter TauE/SafE family protein [Patescibacteria group bacterium]